MCSSECSVLLPVSTFGAARRFHPVARTRATTRDPIAGICELTAVKRQAAAPDAFGEAHTKALELADPLVDPCGPRTRQFRPVRTVRHAILRESGEFHADFVEGQPHSLCEDDERNAANDGARVAAMACIGAFRTDQALVLIETERRCCDSAALGHFGDGQHVFHIRSLTTFGTDFKCT
jgi:hypothetical protein